MVAAKKNNDTLRVGLVVLSITIITLFFVWTRLQNIRLRRELVRLKQLEQKVNLENNRLKLEWAKQTAPKRLEELGEQKFNLHRPKPEQIILVKDPGGQGEGQGV